MFNGRTESDKQTMFVDTLSMADLLWLSHDDLIFLIYMSTSQHVTL